MKRIAILLAAVLLLGCLPGCSGQAQAADIAATTLPVYQFTSMLCKDTGLTVSRLVTESVSCLHDYSLHVSQVKAAEAAKVTVISGAGLEEFMDELLRDKNTIDASAGISLIEGCHEEGHEGHHHEADPHIWLSPKCAMIMAENICKGLKENFPNHAATFDANLAVLLANLQALQNYGEQTLAALSCRKLIPFHDGFSYFAQAFDLEILKAVEEESGSEASAKDLIELIGLVREHRLPAIFVEENGSVAAADVIAAETGAKVYTLSMVMSGQDYFDAMYRNIDTIKEALG